MTYKEYLKKQKYKRIIIKVAQLLILIIFLLSWQLLSDHNIINSFITSSPKNIIITLINLYNQNNLLLHIWTTIKETIIAFSITSILSIIIAIIMYNNSLIAKVIEPYLIVLNSLPKVALGPIIIIWIGANIKSVITISVLISLIVSIQTIYSGFNNTDKIRIKLLKTFNASKKDILMYVILPSNKSIILSSFKINISMCLIGVITGEFLTSKAGIGYLILYGSQVFNLNLVMTGIILLTCISYLLYKLVLSLSKK